MKLSIGLSCRHFFDWSLLTDLTFVKVLNDCWQKIVMLFYSQTHWHLASRWPDCFVIRFHRVRLQCQMVITWKETSTACGAMRSNSPEILTSSRRRDHHPPSQGIRIFIDKTWHCSNYKYSFMTISHRLKCSCEEKRIKWSVPGLPCVCYFLILFQSGLISKLSTLPLTYSSSKANFKGIFTVVQGDKQVLLIGCPNNKFVSWNNVAKEERMTNMYKCRRDE